MADSCEVEVLIMDRQQMQFFPDQIQAQIMRQISRSKHVERPFDDATFAEELKKFDNWDAQVQRQWQTTVEDCYHLRVGKNSSFRDC